jgi:membrane-associated phospholipid phosphatase
MLRDHIRTFDARVDAWIDRHRSPALDRLFYGLSSAADQSLLWHAAGAARAARTGEPAAALRFSAALGIESAVTNGPIKLLFQRVRPAPDQVDGPLPFGMRRPITSSFPSGHATAGFMAASLLARDSDLGVAWFGLAALVAGSRVYVQMHHASDVVAGAALGLGMGMLARRYLPR